MGSLYNSFNSGVSGLHAQGIAMASTAGNISNIGSIGYKGTTASFKTLVTAGDGAKGVASYQRHSMHLNGEISYDTYNTDTNIAIEGAGLLAVNTKSDKTGSTYFTRNGAFNKDENGNFKNTENVFLMAWKVGDETQNTVENLSMVNLSGVGLTAIPTENISLSMNLDALEDKSSGKGTIASLDSINNSNIKTKDVIYPDNDILIGDGVTISTSEGFTNTFTYGGISQSAIASSINPMLGSKNASNNFTALKQGDQFIINTRSIGDTAFTYSAFASDARESTFNSLKTLAEAIDYTEGFAARVVDDNLYVTPVNANDGMTFKNVSNEVIGLSKDITGLFNQDRPQISVESFAIGTDTPIFQATNATTPFIGVNPGDDLTFRMADGSQYIATYSDTPSAANLTFNSLQTLADAINSTAKLDGAVVNGNQLKVNVSNPVNDNTILSISSTGISNLAHNLNIGIDSLFKGNSLENDKIEIFVGAHNNVKSKINIDPDTKLSEISTVTGSSISNNPILGATTNSAVFTTLNNGDSVNITTDSGSSTFTFNTTPTLTTEFNSMTTLVDAINTTTSAQANITNGSLVIEAPSGEFIQSISSTNPDITKELGVKLLQMNNNDSMDITLDNGDFMQFVFKDVADPEILKGEFNNLNTLKTSINTLLHDKLSANFNASYLSVSPGTKLQSNIFSIGGNIADKLGMDVTSKVLDFNFTGLNSGNGLSGTPNTATGEFNDIFTLRDSINKFSDGSLTASIINNGKQLSISALNGGKIKYINDFNTSGSSDFASNMGLKDADIAASLGLNNTTNTFNQFSTLDGLSTLINNSNGITSQPNNSTIQVFTKSVLDTVNFENLTGNGGDIVDLLNLPTSTSGPAYEPTNTTKNMASGNIKPSFFSDINVFDSLGDPHSLRMGFIKFDNNAWGMEVYANNTSEISNGRTDGLLGSGTIDFNSDGTLHNVAFNPLGISSGADNSFKVNWTNNASSSDIALDLGENDPVSSGYVEIKGLRQFNGDYSINELDQDGSTVGTASRIFIDDDGYINAAFTNGTTQKIYRIPLATFDNPDGMHLYNGNLYSQTLNAGDYTLSKVGENGAGHIVTNAVELSNVELSNQLQNLMNINQMYQSCLKILHTSNSLIGELNKIVI